MRRAGSTGACWGGRSLGDGGGVVVAGRGGCRSGLVGGGGGRGLRSECGDLLAGRSGLVVGRRHALAARGGGLFGDRG